MPRYRNALPQLSGKLFLTDGGLETTLVFHERMELPCFAAFDLVKSASGRQWLHKYYKRYVGIAAAARAGFIFESPTWRASRDWAEKLGYTPGELDWMNRASIDLMASLRDKLETRLSPMVISGQIGPRGDGYVAANVMSADEAEAYHAEQITSFAATEADMVAALTMNYVEEAIGVARAAKAAGMPAAISFTTETDGQLPTGQSLKEAIEEVDAETDSALAYYMVNCAHPTHFADALAAGEKWVERIRGLRANASKRSHAELDEAKDLDDGDPAEFGREYRDILGKLPHINVLGGCCGADHRHLEAIAHTCAIDPYRAAEAA
ncbi:MAG: homocysteine S-methyltransferase family protein [Propylenella sp.]